MGRGVKRRKALVIGILSKWGCGLEGADLCALCLVKTDVLVLRGLMFDLGKTLHYIVTAFFLAPGNLFYRCTCMPTTEQIHNPHFHQWGLVT